MSGVRSRRLPLVDGKLHEPWLRKKAENLGVDPDAFVAAVYERLGAVKGERLRKSKTFPRNGTATMSTRPLSVHGRGSPKETTLTPRQLPLRVTTVHSSICSNVLCWYESLGKPGYSLAFPASFRSKR